MINKVQIMDIEDDTVSQHKGKPCPYSNKTCQEGRCINCAIWAKYKENLIKIYGDSIIEML